MVAPGTTEDAHVQIAHCAHDGCTHHDGNLNQIMQVVEAELQQWVEGTVRPKQLTPHDLLP